MTLITPAQILAAESVLREYIQDPSVSAAAIFLKAYTAFISASPPRKPRSSEQDEPEGFAEFYAAFPRRVARANAAKAYVAALKRTTQEVILAGARRYAEECKGRNPHYIKHPATWLNGGCWGDEAAVMLPLGVVFEQTNLTGWLSRLEGFYQDGFWSDKWGGKPPASPTETISSDCRCPQQAFTTYQENLRRRA